MWRYMSDSVDLSTCSFVFVGIPGSALWADYRILDSHIAKFLPLRVGEAYEGGWSMRQLAWRACRGGVHFVATTDLWVSVSGDAMPPMTNLLLGYKKRRRVFLRRFSLMSRPLLTVGGVGGLGGGNALLAAATVIGCRLRCGRATRDIDGYRLTTIL